MKSYQLSAAQVEFLMTCIYRQVNALQDQYESLRWSAGKKQQLRRIANAVRFAHQTLVALEDQKK